MSHGDLGRALVGAVRPNSTAARVAGNVAAMRAAVEFDRSAGLQADVVVEMHRGLMRGEIGDRAGQVRTVQNWIGGSDWTPRDATFIPPDPARVPDLLTDLAGFLDRVDLPPVVHAAVAHAQFETIHPFDDGNGRTGRALVHHVLRRRRLVQDTVVPISTALLADPDRYFDGLGRYRAGDLDGWLHVFLRSTRGAAVEGVGFARRLAEVAERWTEEVRPRRNSTTARLVEGFLREPVLDITAAAGIARTAESNVYRALDRLVDHGVVTQLTAGRRNRVWGAGDVLELLADLERRVGRRRFPAELD